MRSASLIGLCCLAISTIAGSPIPTRAQQVTVGTPMNTVGHSFFENIGTSFGFGGPGFSVQIGPGPTQPLGNPVPGAGLSGGFPFGGPFGSGYFNFNAGQGSRSSMTSQTPMMTLSNGQPGYFGDASVTPFVISHVPVVGGFPTIGVFGPSPVGPAGAGSAADAERLQQWQRVADERAQRPAPAAPVVEAGKPLPAQPVVAAAGSSAELAVPSVAEARRLRAQEQAAQQGDVQLLVEKGLAAEADGKVGLAKVYYEMAARRATGPLKGQVDARLSDLGKAESGKRKAERTP